MADLPDEQAALLKPKNLVHLLRLIEPALAAIHDAVRGARRVLDVRAEGLRKSRGKEVAS